MKCKLSEVMDLIGGGTPKTSKPEYWNGNIPWISVKDFNNDFRYVNKTEKSITELGLQKSTTKLLQRGDVIISARGTVGEIATIPFAMAFNQSCYGLRAKKGIVTSDYLYYLIKHNISVFKKNTHGSVFDTITRNTFVNLEVEIPSIKIQQKISSILNDYDKKIELNYAINNNLLQQLNAIFKHWFTDNPQLDSMSQVPLADLCLVVTKGTTPTTLGKSFVSEGINFIKAESILDSHAIDKNKFAFIDEETNNLLKRSIVCSGDIVFTIAGTLGRFAIIDDSVLPANTNQAVAIIRADSKKVMPQYLYSFFLGNWHNDYYTKRIQQAVQANLSLGTIKSLPIPVLSDKAMTEYLGIISPLITMTKTNELEISKLEATRDALLPQLMSGQLDISEL